MENKKEFNALKKKYFIEQKIKEISTFFLIILVIAILPFILGLWNPLDATMEDVPQSGFFFTYTIGLINFLGIGFFALIIGMFVYVIYYSLSEWINQNWDEADERARRTLKIRKW